MSGRRERIDEIRSDLVAARPDRRSDRDDQIFRSTAEFARHCLDRGDRNSRRRAAPSGMGSADRACPAVTNQQGNAIRRADDQCSVRAVRHQGVRLWPFPGKSVTDDNDVAAVNLIQ